MSTYRIESTIVKTENASAAWKETKDWNGSNHIGRSSGSQWHDQALYRSRRGRYYIEYCSRYDGERDHAEWVSPEEAARWLLLNEHEVPEELAQAAASVEE
jgi:hypothetical protein